MKKVISIFLLLLFVSFSLVSCVYKEYSGNYEDLYTVAINSVLWTNGHSFSADRYTNAKIEIIDTDSYGRTLFTYYEKYYYGADISFSALLVCQSVEQSRVFYYEDVNFIVKEQELYNKNLVSFSDNEIERLKVDNDWNLELNYEKCTSKQITKGKPKIPHDSEIKARAVDEFDLKNDNSLFLTYLTSSSSNSSFIVYGYERTIDTYFVYLIEQSNGEIQNMALFVPKDVFNYGEEFSEFKRANEWK